MSTITHRGVAVLGAAVLAASVMVPLAAHAAPPEILSDPVTFETGHIDAFNLVLDPETNDVILTLKEDVTGSHVLRTPESVTMKVKKEAFRTLNNRPAGLSNEFWYLPLNQRADLIWPGWDTNAVRTLDPLASTDFNVTITSAPTDGQVFVWTLNEESERVSLMKDGSSFQLPNTILQGHPAHTHASWGFSHAGTYKLEVQGVITAAGETYTTNAATYTFVVEPVAVEYSLAISGLSHHYHQGSPIALQADLDPAADGATYRWYVQRTDQAEPQQVTGVTGSNVLLAAEQALDGATVYVEALDADGTVIATADKVTIDVDDHGAAPYNVLSIEGLSPHYHSGEAIELSASANPPSVLNNYRWTVTPAEGEPIVSEGRTLSLEASSSLDGAHIVAELLFDDGEPYVTSEPVTVEVDDHDHEPEPTDPAELTLAIEGLRDQYAPGDNLELVATPHPETELDHWHWFITRVGGSEEVISGATTSALTMPLTAQEDGALIVARLYGDDHSVAAESDPVTVVVSVDEPTGTPTDTPTHTPTDQPTDTPTDSPTDTPTDEPTTSSTDQPTDGTTPAADRHPETGAGGVLPIAVAGVLLLGLGAALVVARSRALS